MDKKVAVITGASSGIGAALAKLLGTKGYHCVLAARREPELKKVAQEIDSAALTVVTDVTRRADVEHLKDAALQHFGQIDIWVNNAGRGIGKRVLELSDDDFNQMIDINLRSALHGMQVIVPYFQQQGRGHLINVSSALGRVPLVSYRSIYSAAKAALNSLTANLRMDLAQDYPNIHISTVMPGVVFTEFHSNALHGTPQFRPGSGSAIGQTAEEVADIISDLIENPRPEVYTNPASAEMVRLYLNDVASFERGMLKRW